MTSILYFFVGLVETEYPLNPLVLSGLGTELIAISCKDVLDHGPQLSGHTGMNVAI